MQVKSPAVKENLHRRLRRIEGQARGVQRMLDEDRECQEIVQQLNAMRSAVHNATILFMRAYAKECLLQTDELDGTERERLVDDFLNLMAKTR